MYILYSINIIIWTYLLILVLNHLHNTKKKIRNTLRHKKIKSISYSYINERIVMQTTLATFFWATIVLLLIATLY